MLLRQLPHRRYRPVQRSVPRGAIAAIDNTVGFDPGIPVGSPWSLPNLGCPSAALATSRTTPQRVVKDTRGGFRLNFIAPMPRIEEAEFSLASYWTYLDTRRRFERW